MPTNSLYRQVARNFLPDALAGRLPPWLAAPKESHGTNGFRHQNGASRRRSMILIKDQET
jgi:hypothetical protein